MRRRDRYEGHIWLAWVHEESRSRLLHLDPLLHTSVTVCMDRLVRKYKLTVVCEQHLDVYTVRCYPPENALQRGLPRFAACYTGNALDMCLSAAVYEYDSVESGDAHYDLTNGEVQRWIA